jgi:hypothetical protein
MFLDIYGVALYRSCLCISSVTLALLACDLADACAKLYVHMHCPYELAIEQATISNLVVKALFLWMFCN